MIFSQGKVDRPGQLMNQQCILNHRVHVVLNVLVLHDVDINICVFDKGVTKMVQVPMFL